MNTVSDDFEIKDSSIKGAGKGVFAKVAIPSASYLYVKPPATSVGVARHVSEIPKEYVGYCIAQENDMYLCPADYENMELVWYLNHSTKPNALKRDDGYYSTRTIQAGEEITIDYNTLGEPEDKKEAFYRNQV